MAFKPSSRRNREDEDIELNITPIMNLMVVLIPLLLSAAQLTELSLLEYLPPAEATAAEDSGAPPSESQGGQETRLNLLLNLVETGAQVSIFQTVEEGPFFYEIPLQSGSYNWKALKDSLWNIKQREVGEPIGTEMIEDELTGEQREVPKYKVLDAREISITATGNAPFQVIINAMDACRNYKIGNELRELFPMVQLKQFQ